SLAASSAALSGLVIALRGGASAHRWGPVVVFAALWTACASYVVLASLAAGRRALRLRTFSVPPGVVLFRPTWLLIRTFLEVTGFGAALAAAVAAFGFPSVGAGILLPFVGSGALLLSPFLREPVGLTFEDLCLRVHLRKNVSFVIPWRSILEVSQTGPAHHRPVNVRVVDPRRAI